MTSRVPVREFLDRIHDATQARDANAVRLILAACAVAVANGEVDASNAALVYQAGRDAYKTIRVANRQTRSAKVSRPAQTQQLLPTDHFTTVSGPDWAAELLAAGSKRKSGTRKSAK